MLGNATWLAPLRLSVGNDADPCSRTAPCKTFAGAISKTAPAGEISVLDPGGYDHEAGCFVATTAWEFSHCESLAALLFCVRSKAEDCEVEVIQK